MGIPKRKHSWAWKRMPLLFWRAPFRQCQKCGARLRLDKLGPRSGNRYAYKGPGDMDYRVVPKLPPCGGPDPLIVESAELASLL